nr:hypothetical protein [Mycolicibacterium fortuitum]
MAYITVDDGDGLDSGQHTLDGDRSCGAAGSEDDDPFFVRVDDGPQRGKESLAVGVVTDEPPVVDGDAVDRSMLRAAGRTSSSSGITACLWGSEQLKPSHPVARAPTTASARSAETTSQLT